MHRAIRAAVCAGLAMVAFAPSAPASAARYAPHQVIVGYAPGATAQERGLAAKLAGVKRVLGRVAGVDAQVLHVAGDARAAAARLNRSPAVLYAEPDHILRATAVPNDPLFAQLYGIHNPNDADLDGPEGWDLVFTDPANPWPTSGVKVGIIDTGIHSSHEDLRGKTVNCAGVRSFGLLGLFADPTIVGGRCADDHGHGTHVAGTVAAVANNAIGVAGVAPNAQLAICKGLDFTGTGPVSAIANCIGWAAAQDVDVISMSFGGRASTTLHNAVRNAWSNGNGAVIVAAAGNGGNSAVSYPAGYPEAVSVAATDSNDQHAAFSQTNGDVEVSAAGVNVLSTRRGGGYVAFSGTSMATPHAAGVAALIAYRYPSLSAAGVRDRLDRGVDDLGVPGRDPVFGFGRVNLVKALS